MGSPHNIFEDDSSKITNKYVMCKCAYIYIQGIYLYVCVCVCVCACIHIYIYNIANSIFLAVILEITYVIFVL